MDFPFTGGMGNAVGGGLDITGAGAFALPTLSFALQAQMSVTKTIMIVSERNRSLLMIVPIFLRISSNFFYVFVR
jgi:hypothetical protein